MVQHQDLDLVGLAAPEDHHREREHAPDGDIGERPQSNGRERAGTRRGRTVVGSIEGTNFLVRRVLVFSNSTEM
jgi:hypothetical protein